MFGTEYVVWNTVLITVWGGSLTPLIDSEESKVIHLINYWSFMDSLQSLHLRCSVASIQHQTVFPISSNSPIQQLIITFSLILFTRLANSGTYYRFPPYYDLHSVNYFRYVSGHSGQHKHSRLCYVCFAPQVTVCRYLAFGCLIYSRLHLRNSSFIKTSWIYNINDCMHHYNDIVVNWTFIYRH